MNSFFIHRRYVRWGTSVYTIKPTEDSDKEIKIINGASRKDIDGGDIYLKEIKDLSDDDFEYSIINTLVKKISGSKVLTTEDLDWILPPLRNILLRIFEWRNINSINYYRDCILDLLPK